MPIPPRDRLIVFRFLLRAHPLPGTCVAGENEVRMATDIRLKEGLPEITEALVPTYTECRYINHLGHKPLPSREVIVEIVGELLDILYPGYWRRQNLHIGNVE